MSELEDQIKAELRELLIKAEDMAWRTLIKDPDLMTENERLRDELARRDEELKRVRVLFAGGPDTPCRTTWGYLHYTSTYCIHAHHEDCRGTCKVCESPCLCDCHKALL